VAAAGSRNASYHEIWYWDAASQTFGVLRIVPANRAAHSMNPAQPPWAPNALVREILGDKWWNPNSFSYAVSFAGMPADLVAAMRHPAFVLGAARRTRELLAQETTITHPRPLFNHGEGQPSTRYDWGTELRPAIYAALSGATLPDTGVPMQLPEIIKRINGQFTRPLAGKPLHHQPVTGEEGAYHKAGGTEKLYPYAVVRGQSYGTDQGPRDDYLAFVANDGARVPALGVDGYVAAIYAEPLQDVVVTETVEVPTGITQTQLSAAKAAARAAGIKAAAANAAATL
jgi:hypothetical protein